VPRERRLDRDLRGLRVAISPTMILSGSWRRIERRPRANVRPFFSLIGICVIPRSWYFDRVFDGDDLVLDRLDSESAAYSRRRLAGTRSVP